VLTRFEKCLLCGSVALAVFILFMMFYSIAAEAATQPVLSWTAPTLDSDNVTSVVGPLTYNVYEGPKGPTGKTLVGSQVTRTSYSAVHAGMCYQVSAVDKSGIEGLLSAEICDTVPNPPTGLSIK
jgi:hypothetical protein